MLVVHNSLPVHNVKEFIEYSKAQPAGLDYATSGPGTSTHLAAEMFKTMTGAKLVHVPFKGNAEVLNALLGGHVKVHFALTASTLQHVRSGALRVLAVTTEKRLPELPDVPTIAELGYPGYEISSWQGVFAPAGTPKDIIDKLNGEIVAMLQDAGGAGADHPRGRRSGRQLARAMVRAVQERSGEVGQGGQKRRARQPRTERVAHWEAPPCFGLSQAQRCSRCCRPAARRPRRTPPRIIPIAPSTSSCRSRPAGRPTSPRGCSAQRMNEDWGQPVIVDNRPGGNTVIGAQQVAKAAPDGYTLLMAIDSTLVMNQYLYKSLPYDPINDFAPITTTTKTVSVLAVSGRDGPEVREGADRARPRPSRASSTTAPAPSPRS